jgi:hypothetical protein
MVLNHTIVAVMTITKTCQTFAPKRGFRLHDLCIVGYIDGQEVAGQQIASSRLPHHLEWTTDTDQLYADGTDMTRLIFPITDEFGNIIF